MNRIRLAVLDDREQLGHGDFRVLNSVDKQIPDGLVLHDWLDEWQWQKSDNDHLNVFHGHEGELMFGRVVLDNVPVGDDDDDFWNIGGSDFTAFFNLK